MSSGDLARSKGALGIPAIEVSLSFSRTGRSPVSLSEAVPPSFEALSLVASAVASFEPSEVTMLRYSLLLAQGHRSRSHTFSQRSALLLHVP